MRKYYAISILDVYKYFKRMFKMRKKHSLKKRECYNILMKVCYEIKEGSLGFRKKMSLFPQIISQICVFTAVKIHYANCTRVHFLND